MIAFGFLVVEMLRGKKTSGWTRPRVRKEMQVLLNTWTEYVDYVEAGSTIP